MFHASHDVTVRMTTCPTSGYAMSSGAGRTDFNLSITVRSACPVTNSSAFAEETFIGASLNPECAEVRVDLYPELMGTNDFWVTVMGVGGLLTKGRFQVHVNCTNAPSPAPTPVPSVEPTPLPTLLPTHVPSPAPTIVPFAYDPCRSRRTILRRSRCTIPRRSPRHNQRTISRRSDAQSRAATDVQAHP